MLVLRSVIFFVKYIPTQSRYRFEPYAWPRPVYYLGECKRNTNPTGQGDFVVTDFAQNVNININIKSI